MIIPAVFVVPSQSEVAPDGATGGSSEQTTEHSANIVESADTSPDHQTHESPLA